MDLQEEDRDHIDRVWVQDKTWLDNSTRGNRSMKSYNVPHKQVYKERGFLGLIEKYPLAGSIVVLTLGSLFFIIITFLYF